MLVCKDCGQEKPEVEFYRNSGMVTGHMSCCKVCVRTRVRAYQTKNIEKVRAYDRERSLQPHRVEKNKYNSRTKYNRLRPPIRELRARDPVAAAARIALGNAVRGGQVVKPDGCENCGAGDRIHGHHEDYSKPLDVRWLCPTCHGKRHREINEERRASRQEAAE